MSRSHESRSDIVGVTRRAGGRRTSWVSVYTIKPWQGVCDGDDGPFSTKCLICRGVKISSLKAYEVALCRMVLCYLPGSCNYSVWTLLRAAFRDETGGREGSGSRERRESKDEWREKTPDWEKYYVQELYLCVPVIRNAVISMETATCKVLKQEHFGSNWWRK